MADTLIPPHGGALIINLANEKEQLVLQQEACGFLQFVVSARVVADLEMLAIGAYSPLKGFLNQADYLSVVNEMHLSNGLPWSIPITFSVTPEQAAQVQEGSQVALADEQKRLMAVLTVEEKYTYKKQAEAWQVYRTVDEAHPGVNILYQQGEVLLGGPVRVVALPEQRFTRYRDRKSVV